MSSPARIEPTPTPWRVCANTPSLIENEAGDTVAQTHDVHDVYDDSPKRKGLHTMWANAAFIVTAVNSHADLVKALEDIRGGHFDGAGTLAVSGSWKLIVERLQKIAADALASPTPAERNA